MMDFPKTLTSEDMDLAIKEWKLSGCHIVRPWWETEVKSFPSFTPCPVVVGDGKESVRYIWNEERQEWKAHPYNPRAREGVEVLERP